MWAHAPKACSLVGCPCALPVLCALRACVPADLDFLALVAVRTTPRGRWPWLAHMPLQLAGAARGRRPACGCAMHVPCAEAALRRPLPPACGRGRRARAGLCGGPGGGALARRWIPAAAPAPRLWDAVQKPSPDAAGSRNATQLQGAAPHPPSAQTCRYGTPAPNPIGGSSQH